MLISSPPPMCGTDVPIGEPGLPSGIKEFGCCLYDSTRIPSRKASLICPGSDDDNVHTAYTMSLYQMQHVVLYAILAFVQWSSIY